LSSSPGALTTASVKKVIFWTVGIVVVCAVGLLAA
jgi:hypothetical protein